MEDLYHPRILELAADMPHVGRLTAPDGASTKVSRVCGSVVTVELKLKDGLVSEIAVHPKACALGQAATGVLAMHAIGASPQEIREARDGLRAMLKEGAAPTDGALLGASAPGRRARISAAPYQHDAGVRGRRGSAGSSRARKGELNVRVRAAIDADADAIWATLEPIIREGETLTLPRDMSREDALAYWCAPAHEVSVAERDGVVLGVSYLRANQQGPGAHVANAGYATAPQARGQGVARALLLHSLERAKARGLPGDAIQYCHFHQ